MSLPAKADINSYPDDLDGAHAVETFFGKTLENIEKMFSEGEMGLYTEDLMFMGPIAFSFYFKAVDRYVRGSVSREDYSVFFLTGVLETQGPELRGLGNFSVIDEMKELIVYVLDNWEKFLDACDSDGMDDEKEDWLKAARNI